MLGISFSWKIFYDKLSFMSLINIDYKKWSGNEWNGKMIGQGISHVLEHIHIISFNKEFLIHNLYSLISLSSVHKLRFINSTIGWKFFTSFLFNRVRCLAELLCLAAVRESQSRFKVSCEKSLFNAHSTFRQEPLVLLAVVIF